MYIVVFADNGVEQDIFDAKETRITENRFLITRNEPHAP